eukprot:CAMPEP_0119302508 /NCGR_PEP_ID=MMETSP1333-20130426/4096_1 /TAXON_ID=418940 /ORGANISM="Scyphosphaera apsteinii, Strain RCC1455" /LENGTH=214 /DNA_ID=CAMNT_0007304887 /DNA_START=48 /DNA_END=692 /DNA_ORIENTATION=-
MTGCHNLECQQFYRMDPVHFYAPGVAHLTTLDDDTIQQATAIPGADSATSMLTEWSLTQGNLLRPPPSSTNDHSETSLRARLRAYFDSVVTEQQCGYLNHEQLHTAFSSLGLKQDLIHSLLVQEAGHPQDVTSFAQAAGASGRANLMSPNVSCAGADCDDDDDALHKHITTSLTFDEFVSIIEAAMSACGVRVKHKCKKVVHGVEVIHRLKTWH